MSWAIATTPIFEELCHCSELGLNGQNPRISLNSCFLDDVWNFEGEIPSPTQSRCHKLIQWSFKVWKDLPFTSPKFGGLLLASRQMFYAMMWQPELNRRHKPASIVTEATFHRPFVTFLICHSPQILRFQDVTPQIMKEYVHSLRSSGRGKLTPATLYMHFRALQRLFIYRNKMHDSLTFDPFLGTSPAKAAGYTKSYVDTHRTDFIPDELLSRLVTQALDYVEHHADYLIPAAQEIWEIRSTVNKTSFQGYCNRALRKRCENVCSSLDVEAKEFLSNAFRSARELQRHLSRLRTSCFILIAFMTGMRIGEILSLVRGSVKVEDTEDGEFVWIVGTTYKMEQEIEGVEAKWLCGPLGRRAIAVLERLTDITRESSSCRSVFVPVTKVGEKNWAGVALSQVSIARDLKDYCKWLQLKDQNGHLFHLHPHMFRRTFARQVIRSDSTNLLALKSHFKHVSIAMTDGYLGFDDELLEILSDEEAKLSIETFDRAMKAERLGGLRGRELTQQIDTAIADGRLSPEFRGEAGSHLRMEMIRDLMEAGQQVFVCGMGNICWYRAEAAMCSRGSLPVIEMCNPLRCTCSIVLPEHATQWREIADKTDILLNIVSSESPAAHRMVEFRQLVDGVLEAING